MPADALADLETELKAVKEELEASRKNLKALTNGSSTLHVTNFPCHQTRTADRWTLFRSTEINMKTAEPKTDEIESEIEKVEAQVRFVLCVMSHFLILAIPTRSVPLFRMPSRSNIWHLSGMLVRMEALMERVKGL
jgi:hypothetical protein